MFLAPACFPKTLSSILFSHMVLGFFLFFLATSLLASGFCICHLFRCHPPKFSTSGAQQSLDVLLTQMSPLQRNFLILSSQLVFTPSPRHTHILYGSPSASLSGFIFLLKVYIYSYLFTFIFTAIQNLEYFVLVFSGLIGVLWLF